MRFLRSLIAGALLLVLSVTSAFAQPSFLGQVPRFVAKEATGSVSTDELGRDTIITNAGASAGIVLTLPDCDSAISTGGSTYAPKYSTVGMVVNVLLTVAQDVDLNPQNDDTITGRTYTAATAEAAIAGAAGDAISSAAAIGNAVTLVCVGDDAWVIQDGVGLWTDVN